MESLQNKVVLITGASTGIGACTARTFAGFKSRLALVARSTDKLKQIQTQCEAAGSGKGNVLVITADMAKHDDLARVVSETVTAFGQIDVLVNNAAAFAINDCEHTSSDEFDGIMSVNVKAPFFLAQAALPHLKKTKGSVINISSVAASVAYSGMVSYSISKAALEHFTHVLANETATSGVRVNSVRVGFTNTDTQEDMLKAVGIKAPPTDFSCVQPLGGACSMQDVAAAVLFLASDLSAALTGVCMPVDRGYGVTPPAMPPSAVLGMAGLKSSGIINAAPTGDRLEAMKAAAAAAAAAAAGKISGTQ